PPPRLFPMPVWIEEWVRSSSRHAAPRHPSNHRRSCSNHLVRQRPGNSRPAASRASALCPMQDLLWRQPLLRWRRQEGPPLQRAAARHHAATPSQGNWLSVRPELQLQSRAVNDTFAWSHLRKSVDAKLTSVKTTYENCPDPITHSRSITPAFSSQGVPPVRP